MEVRILTTNFTTYDSGKLTENYGKSPFYSWVNQLFRLGHGFNSYFGHYQRV